LKAISLWQPWASLMAEGLKLNETRPRRWSYSGDLVICSAQKRIEAIELSFDLCRYLWAHRDRFPGYSGNVPEILENLPYGKCLAVVSMYACMKTEEVVETVILTRYEEIMGDYSPGRFVYFTKNCRKLAEPIPFKGKQGVMNLPAEIEQKIRGQLLEACA
jgi:activating signal cointegrator 1